jgi:hypothetical protein
LLLRASVGSTEAAEKQFQRPERSVHLSRPTPEQLRRYQNYADAKTTVIDEIIARARHAQSRLADETLREPAQRADPTSAVKRMADTGMIIVWLSSVDPPGEDDS